MITISNNPSLMGLSSFKPGVVYSGAGGQELSMDMLIPQHGGEKDSRRFPLILFVQGSAWHCPDTNYEIPQLARFAAAGYAVASIRHRNISDGYPAPAFLQDAKTAIRFLRANAEEYHIDSKRVYAFGTSSGGNTVLLLGLTGDDEAFKTEEYRDQSDAVSAVIDCFGPTDLLGLLSGSVKELVTKKEGETERDFRGKNGACGESGLSGADEENIRLVREFCGGVFDEELMRRMSPLYYVQEGKSYVHFLIAHGNQDELVDFSQSQRMVQRLKECGADAQLICVDGAEHEGTFWSQKLLDLFLDFLNHQSGLDRKNED